MDTSQHAQSQWTQIYFLSHHIIWTSFLLAYNGHSESIVHSQWCCSNLTTIKCFLGIIKNKLRKNWRLQWQSIPNVFLEFRLIVEHCFLFWDWDATSFIQNIESSIRIEIIMHVMGPHENKRAEGDYMQLEKNCMVKERAFHLFFTELLLLKLPFCCNFWPLHMHYDIMVPAVMWGSSGAHFLWGIDWSY